MEVSKDIIDFLTGIHDNEKQVNDRKKMIFDRAFELAYKDMATHTVAYKKNAKEKYFYGDNKSCNKNRKLVKDKIKFYLKKEIFGGNDLKKMKEKLISQKEFNEWHEKACNSFTEIDVDIELESQNKSEEKKKLSEIFQCKDESHIFSIGQAQKLINMMIKYIYIYDSCEEESFLTKEVLVNIEKYAHAPLDSYVLNKIDKESYDGQVWSKIAKYEEYKKYCELIKKIAEDKDKSPFLWELKYWPFEWKYN